MLTPVRVAPADATTQYQISIAICIIFPLCMLRSMEKLQYTSLAALVCISAFVVTVSFLGMWSALVPETRSNVINGRGEQLGDLHRDGSIHGAEDPHCLATTPMISGLDTRAYNETKASYHVQELPAEPAIKLFPDSLRQVRLRKRVFFENDHAFYQGRLGTNIGKALKTETRFFTGCVRCSNPVLRLPVPYERLPDLQRARI